MDVDWSASNSQAAVATPDDDVEADSESMIYTIETPASDEYIPIMSDWDTGYFCGTVQTIDGIQVPTGFGYVVLSSKILRTQQVGSELQVQTRRHNIFLQGDWSVTEDNPEYYLLRLFGQRIKCNSF